MRSYHLWLLVVWLFAAPAGAVDFYVSNTQGNDLNDGSHPQAIGDRQGPFRTIARALRSAASGDQIIIENTGQAYHESITLQAGRHSGLGEQPFRLVGNGAVLDGTEPIPVDAWEAHDTDVHRFAAERKSFQVLYLDGKPAKRRPRPDDHEGIPELEPLEWCLHEGYVYFRTEPGKLPWSYALTHTVLPVGITLYEVRNVAVQDLIVQGFAIDGINAHDGVFEGELLGLTCRGNGRSGISIGGASRVRIEACLVGDNGAAQLRTEGYCEVRIVNCDLIDSPLAPALDRDAGDVVLENPAAETARQVFDERKIAR